MITERDRDIINFIYQIGFATIEQIEDMYFTNQKSGYDLARRRLKSIKETGSYIKTIKNLETNQIIYIPLESTIKKISLHNIKVLDYICKIKKLGADIEEIQIEPEYCNTIPDAYIKFKLGEYRYYQIIEMQLRHDFIDLERYVSSDVIDKILDKTNNTIPRLIIIQDTRKDYSSNNPTNMDIVQMYTDMSDIAKVLC